MPVPEPDGHEVDQAGYFTLEEIQALNQVPAINLEIAQRALDLNRRLLAPCPMLYQPTGAMYTLFLG